MSDQFQSAKPELDSPASGAFAVTPGDDNDLPFVTRAIYVGGAGDIVMIMAGDSAPVTRKNVPAGGEYPWRIKRILQSGTTATLIVGDY